MSRTQLVLVGVVFFAVSMAGSRVWDLIAGSPESWVRTLVRQAMLAVLWTCMLGWWLHRRAGRRAPSAERRAN